MYRTKDEPNLKNYGKKRLELINEAEWGELDNRVEESAWITRYEYEAKLIVDICKNKGYKKILELGSGPGVLGQKIMQDIEDCHYTFVDKIGAKKKFISKGYKGSFLVKDMMNGLDVSDLDTDYDLIIANDFLEHVANPSDIVYKITTITHEKSGFFVSVPNWRMGHVFIYRGLFDYDNFRYFCTVHGWHPKLVFDSPLITEDHHRICTEATMDPSLTRSWNWYFFNEKIIEPND